MGIAKDTKAKIQEAILESLVVNCLSFNEISIAGICRKAGVARKSFYNHFTSLEEAARSLVDVQISKALHKVDECMNSDSSFEEKLDFFKTSLISSYQREFTRDLLDRLKSEAPHILEEHNRRLEEVFEKMVVLVRQGQQQGKVRETVNPRVAVSLLYQAALVLNLHEYSAMDDTTTEQAICQAFDIIINGIMKANDIKLPQNAYLLNHSGNS